jgi:MFS transporter, ACS family, tartrate transporter
VWVVSASLLCVQTAGYAYQLSAPAILEGATGLSVAGVGWLVSGAGLLGAVAMLVNATHSDRTEERRWHVAGPFLLVALMFLASGLLKTPWVVAGALTVVSVCMAGLQTPLLAVPASFLTGKSMAAGAATINMVATTGGFIGPWAMGVAKDHTGDYRMGLVALVAPSLIGAALVLTLRVGERVRVVVGVVAEREV